MIQKFQYSAIVILALTVVGVSQDFNFVFEPDSIPVNIDDWQLYCPWMGGVDESAPDFCDIDADGDLDLFVGDYFGGVSYYKNNGNMNFANYDLFAIQFDSLEIIAGWGRSNPDFYDMDNDGDFDAIIGSGMVTYVENIGTISEPNFLTLRDSLYDTEGNFVFGTHVALIDIDLDGDGDLICGEYQGHLQFYRNIGTPDSFSLYLEDDNWLDINVYDDADPCFVDIDNDNDLDLFIGNEQGKIWFYRNDGDSVNYNYTFVTDYYENIDVGYQSSPEFADIDGDGDADFFVGFKRSISNSSIGDIYFYENIGNPETPVFISITNNYVSLDLNQSANPQFLDINGDSILDLLLGNAYWIAYLENTGNNISSSFDYITGEFQNIYIDTVLPHFIDIDNDGDYDLLCGEGAIPGPPSIALYINRGTSLEPDLVLYDDEFITNPNFFVCANPGCVDIDADGDKDLFITETDGGFYFYRNDGTPEWPDFTLITNQWIPETFPNVRPFCFADIDNDGDYDLFMESFDQYNLTFYRNIGTPLSANMVLESEMLLPEYDILFAWPTLTDIDNDNDLDLFCGTGNGGIMFFRNWGDSTGVVSNKQISPYTFTLQANYPNPFNAQTVIPFTLDFSGRVIIDIFDITGRLVGAFRETPLQSWYSAGMHEVVWNAEGLASGVYLVRLTVDGKPQSAGTLRHSTRKVVLVK